MAIKIAYKIRKKLAPRSEEEVVIYVRVTESNRKDFTLASPLSIPYRFWDPKAGSIKNGLMLNDRVTLERLQLLDQRLSSMRQHLYEELFRRGIDFTKEDVKQIMDDYMQSLDEESFTLDPRSLVQSGVLEYLRILVDRMKNGMKRIGGETYSASTIKAWNSFIKIMEEFNKWFKQKTRHDLRWEDFNQDAFPYFLRYMEEAGYLPTSINKYIKDINALVSAAKEDGILGKLEIRKHCPRKQLRRDEQPLKVYLTEDELEALYKMPLEEGSVKCQIRDVFLCGCYTGQRISDYNNLSPANFKKTPKGYNVVCLTQEKTNTTVWIPILNQNLLKIAKKYHYRMPKVVEQVLNRYIKGILRDLSETVPSLAQKFPTVLTMKEIQAEKDGKVKFERTPNGTPLRPKYELITSHTARRSCITNLYLQGKFTNEQIMSISGHRDEKVFKDYIVCSGVVIAEKIIEINESGTSNEALFM